MNWYSKRLILAAIYKSTELFMIQDKSENFEETWKFLDRRFEDHRSFHELTKNVDSLKSFVSGSLAVVSAIKINLKSKLKKNFIDIF